MSIKNYFPKDLVIFLSVVVPIILIFFFVLFGITGVRVVFGIIVVWIPFYLILSCFELALGEKFIFSLLMGVTVFPTIVYIFGLLISFRVSIAITFLLLMGIFLLIRRFQQRKQQES